MRKLYDYLIKNMALEESECYALVKYADKEEVMHFTKYYMMNGVYFQESPCVLHKIKEIQGDIDTFCNDYAEEILTSLEEKDNFIEEMVKPMIVNNILYEIEIIQKPPFIPRTLKSIKKITEREALLKLIERGEFA